MKKRNRNLLTVTAIAAALLLTGCGSALEGGVASINKSHETLATGAHGTQLSGKTIVKQEVDKEDNTVEYEYIENGKEVEVEVDAATGEVIETETEPVEEVKKEAKTEAKAEVKTITLAEAKAKAIAHAKVDESTLYDVSAELDDGVYEVEFSSKGTEYNYKISKTGEILKNYTEVDDDYVEKTTKTETKSETKKESTTKTITLEEAKAKAIAHAKVDESTLYDVSAELDDGVYEVEFSSKGTEYNYKISKQGEILKNYTEVDDDYVEKTTKTETKSETKRESTSKTITLAEAKAKAIAHAGVKESALYDVSAELDDGVYEVEFSSKGTEYNYKISKTGEILKNYTEVDDDYVEPTKTETKKITKSKAKSIALNHAGVKADSIRGYEIELDDGVYEISFEKGRTEYEYEIKATTGEILRHSKEKDD